MRIAYCLKTLRVSTVGSHEGTVWTKLKSSRKLTENHAGQCGFVIRSLLPLCTDCTQQVVWMVLKTR